MPPRAWGRPRGGSRGGRVFAGGGKGRRVSAGGSRGGRVFAGGIKGGSMSAGGGWRWARVRGGWVGMGVCPREGVRVGACPWEVGGDRRVSTGYCALTWRAPGCAQGRGLRRPRPPGSDSPPHAPAPPSPSPTGRSVRGRTRPAGALPPQQRPPLGGWEPAPPSPPRGACIF